MSHLNSTIKRRTGMRMRLSDLAVFTAALLVIAMGFVPIPEGWAVWAFGVVVLLLALSQLLYPFTTRFKQFWVRRDPVVDPTHVRQYKGTAEK